MSEGKRPGGLTALAVINIIWGAITVLVAMGLVAAPLIVEKAAEGGDEQAQKALQEMRQALEDMGALWYVVIGITCVSAVLLLMSGIGYLKQKKFLGRTLGNVWAILSIVGSALGGFMTAEAVGGGFSTGTIVGLVYPVLTLILLNGTFKEDFVR